MTLGDFISTVLRQIVDGVADAQEAVASRGGEVNPHLDNLDKLEGKGSVLSTYEDLVQPVEFDVAITTLDEASGDARLAVLKSGVGVASSERDQVISRIRFAVPVRLPRTRKDEPA